MAWYVRAKALYTSCVWKTWGFPLPYGIDLRGPLLPPLVYALYLHPLVGLFNSGVKQSAKRLWSVAFAGLHDELISGEELDASVTTQILAIVPDVDLVEWLLKHDFNPNKEVGNHTIWECVVYIVHILGYLHEPHLEP